ncbi:hypothetical protein C1T31_04810 [Hanstruepera neustonica]|uniref:Glycosyltransferase 2-like domain-containing protein n=1 Tax=Hanstruepera neustonica TaxID=1445657 RepID=A0A2K1E044_9FLAO|nr:glycosyltransferase [Hanstruepera neustonica]PNQ73662.1 hypothetical protein C1T31_04810 [Hanstruepera neustonica]
MELVSVIISTYNGSKFIETQLKSLINQTYNNLDIIVVDDASTDNTKEIVNTFAKEYKNITTQYYEKNVGYIKNFERGMSLAKGSLIATCDQDDWWDPTKIEKLVNNIGDHDIIYCDSGFTNQYLETSGNSFSKIKNLISSNDPLNFVIENCVSGHASLIKKSLFDKSTPFPDLIPYDWWLTFMASLNNGITYHDEILVKYRFHDNNTIVSDKKNIDKEAKLLEKKHRVHQFHEAIPENHYAKKVLRQIDNSYSNFSFVNNIKRVTVFLLNSHALLKILKKSYFKKMIFCFSMFFKVK